MTSRELINLCLQLPNTYEDYPFDGGDAHSDSGTWAMIRHRVNQKGFAHIYERNGKLCINLKCDPLEADLLRQAFVSVVPGWHMNKQHWNTVILGGDVPTEELRRQIEQSYDLIKPKPKAKRRV
jgi:predicted DNA-binding protein (MmcQ/YjbR family)